MRYVSGGRKWLALLASILVIEVLPGPTLSSAHCNAVKHPKAKWPILVAHAYLIAHLWDVIPDRYDPLSNLAKVTVDKRGNRG